MKTKATTGRCRKLVLCLTGLAFAALAMGPEEKKPEPRKVLSVDEVTVKAAEGPPAKLTVEAAGMVNSGGWTKPALRLVVGNADPGTLVFEFVALPPTGMATQALMPVKASVTVEKPAAFKQVQVIAQTNTKTAQ